MKPEIVLLHGWGKFAPDKLEGLKNELEILKFRAHTISLPGFGGIAEPQSAWGIENYAKFVINKCQDEKIKNPVLFGHSFGGQIAAFITSYKLMPIKALILCESASLRPNLALHKKIIRELVKIGKIIPSNYRLNMRKIASKLFPYSDYYQASDTMKQIVIRVTQEDLGNILSQISVPTLIVWGDRDKTLPLPLAGKHQKLIHNSQLQIIYGASHSLPYTHIKELSKIMDNFLTKL